jgi:hypothetical protein
MRAARKLIGPCLGALALGCAGIFATSGAPVGNRDAAEPTLVVRFVQTNEQGLEKAQAWLGFSLDPQVGRCLLTEGEAKDLLAALEGANSNTLGEAALPVSPGAEQKLSTGRQIKYATEFKRTEPIEGHEGEVSFVAEEEATRELGFSGTAMISPLDESRRWRAVLKIETTELAGWRTFGREDVRMPVFRCWNLMTSLLLVPGETAVMVNRPHMAFAESGVFPKGQPTRDKVFLVFVSLQSGD